MLGLHTHGVAAFPSSQHGGKNIIQIRQESQRQVRTPTERVFREKVYVMKARNKTILRGCDVGQFHKTESKTPNTAVL